MRIVIAGSSGFLGGHLVSRLAADGHTVTRLVRREPAADDERSWDPGAGRLDRDVLDGADAVVNLAGAGVGDRRWTESYKQLIRSSRVSSTRLLAEAVAEAGVPVLMNASAMGWYGDTGDREVDESAPAAEDFLGRVCAEWEAATSPAADAGARVVRLRTGMVLAADAPFVRRLRRVFKLGIGGRIGSGRQYFPWVSLSDWIDAAVYLLEHDVSGPVNMVGPQTVTNAEFTRSFGRVLRRPTIMVIPGFAVRVAAGEVAVELLRGARARPAALTDAGFDFTHRDVTSALTATESPSKQYPK